MKSDNITDIRTSIKNGIWCSSKHGHEVLEQAWNEHKPEEKIVLIFSVVRRYEAAPSLSLWLSVNNFGSSQYCGIAEMTGPVNVDARPDIFLEKDREGYFSYCSSAFTPELTDKLLKCCPDPMDCCKGRTICTI